MTNTVLRQSVELVRTVGEREVEVSFSSETPIDHSDTGIGFLTLSHDPSAVDLSRVENGVGAVLLEHDREKQIGTIVRAWIDQSARKGRAILRFGDSELAREVWRDVRAGVRRGISLGIDLIDWVERSPGHWRATRWGPLEISVVSIPRDISVGIGRSIANRNSNIGGNMTKPNNGAVTDLPRQYTADEIGEVTRLAQEYGFDAADCVRRGQSIDQVRIRALEIAGSRDYIQRRAHREESAGSRYLADPSDRRHEEDHEPYNLLRAVRCAANGQNCHERELSQDLARKSGMEPGGILVPVRELVRSLSVLGDSGAKGGSLVPVEHREFIDVLRPRLSVARLGATILNGLHGDLSLPRQVAASTVGWKPETGNLDEASPGFDALSLRPKRVGSYAVFSKQLLAQSDPSVQRILSNDLLQALAVAIDRAAISGSGTGNEPAGVLNTEGVTVHALGVDGGAVEYSDLVELVRLLADEDADEGALAFLTNPKVRAFLQQAIFDAGSGLTHFEKAQALGAWAVSTNVPSNLTKGTGTNLSALIYGDWSQVIIGSWGDVVDLVVDPFSQAVSGQTRIVLNAFVDVGVRRAEKFVVAEDVDTTIV